MMGPGIAVTLALGRVRATILGRTEESAGRGLDAARTQLQLLEDKGLAAPDKAAWAREHLDARAGYEEAVAAADLVVESAPENMEFKQRLFAGLEEMARPDAVLASNTSGLSITAIASRCRNPERILTTHFWNPPHLMPLVEIVKGQKTSGEIAERVRALLAACGKVPVIVHKDTPGQLGNRLQFALVREALHIVEEGIASIDDIDLAAKNGFGLRLPVYGIFEHQDVVGLDMALAIHDYVAQDLCNENRAPRPMRERVERGELGAKTGKGFYDWTLKSVSGVKARRDAFVLDFLQRWRAR